MCQIWHFELEALLHLPFMLRAANDRRYEYSRVSALNASRSLIKRWLAIRESQSTFYFSNLLEFEAFTAAITLLLGVLGQDQSMNRGDSQERDEDSRIVERVVHNLVRLKRQGSGMSVGDQSISVIRTLQRFLYKENFSGALTLEIPFFGMIRIAHMGAVQPLEGERILGANPRQNTSLPRSAKLAPPSSTLGTGYSHDWVSPRETPDPPELVERGEVYTEQDVAGNATILQFSGGYLQLPDMPDVQSGRETNEWPDLESDMIFFDSLVNTDLVGNWTF